MHDRTNALDHHGLTDSILVETPTRGGGNGKHDPPVGTPRSQASRSCADCGHPTDRHELPVEEEFAVAHGGVGYAYCQDVVRTGELADICACRIVVGSSAGGRAALWPTDRPSIATIPSPGAPLTTVSLISTEVTTTDPITGQPDFETVEISYVPDARLIDSKSLKAYWLWWRGRGASMERLSALVADDVASATGAQSVEVIVREAPRGGIAIVATSRVERRDG